MPTPIVLPTLHLIDIENLHGACPRGTLNVGRATALLERYDSIVPIAVGDHLIVGCNPGIGLEVGLAIGGGRLVVRGGPDGADQALIDSIDLDHVARRNRRVVIGSGDHIFVRTVLGLLARSVPVEVVGRPGGTSAALRLTGVPVHPFVDAMPLPQSA
ncbi:hypothetical protein [Aquihabitans sp. McL0605]|uniref:hypothetical protein n=1 Tax=Aquihabitans sp. McL0605 TaxID=3415671 RepID=UPI003CED247A